jgi:hypothetical protein
MLGDGIRRNIATVTKEERDRFRDAIVKLQSGDLNAPGDGLLKYSDGVSFFGKQEWIHWAGHELAHGGRAFFGWHRELCNRFEAMLRAVDPQLSLHYWDWTTDPRDQVDLDGNHFSLFTSDFMGDDGSSAANRIASDGGGDAGAPFAAFGTIVNGGVPPAGTVLKAGVTLSGPLADLPGHNVIWRAVGPSGVPVTNQNPTASATPKPVPPTAQPNSGGPLIASLADALLGKGVALDSDVLTAADAIANQDDRFKTFAKGLNGPHNYLHQYLSGTIGTEHISLGDPFFFLMHSNLDRLWASWQRALVGGVPQLWRLDPNQTYGDATNPDPSLNDSFPPWDGTGGILLAGALIPWDGTNANNSKGDGLINTTGGLVANHAIVSKTAKDPTVVLPASYDTAVHTSYIVTNRDTFSTSEVAAKGNPAAFASAFYIIFDGFTPRELGVASTPLPTVPPNLPTFAFVGANQISAVNPSASYENPGGTVDMPQRIMISYDLRFANANDFPANAGGQAVVNMLATLNYTVDTGTGGAVINMQERTAAPLLLVNQPNPYMNDVDPIALNPYWLSFDTRVFQRKTSDPALAGVSQGDMDADPNAPFTFIQGVVSAFSGLPDDNSHPFLTQLSSDESASQLELSQKVGGQRVYNYAIAKVRYLAPATVDSGNFSVFFRLFSTAVSGLDYDATSGNRGNYRRSGNSIGAVPLLGIENDAQGQPETASLPFFAVPRTSGDMTTQSPDTPNTQSIQGTGTEKVAYFGVWLDINLAPGDPNFHQFPLQPLADPGGPNGPFTGSVNSIQQLMLGTHHCMVAEIFTGVSPDPIAHNASPSSSDRLAQRNLVLVQSGNPGWPATHTVQTTFVVKPSVITTIPTPQVKLIEAPAVAAMKKGGKRGKEEEAAAAAAVGKRYRGPDELIIRWNNVPRDSTATFYFPEVQVDEILALALLRQHPNVLQKLDPHTLKCQLSDVTFLPLPSGLKGTMAGLMSLTLPPGVRVGQTYRLSVEQYSGFTLKTMGAFQMTIPVRPDPEILPGEIRKLSVMRYIQQAIPATSRWYNIFLRYVNEIAARVKGFGGDPDAVKPSPDGGEGQVICHPCPPKPEVCPPDLWCLNIPWKECDIEGEIDLKLRFKRKCK